MVDLLLVALVSVFAGFILMVVTEVARKSSWGWMPYIILLMFYPSIFVSVWFIALTIL